MTNKISTKKKKYYNTNNRFQFEKLKNQIHIYVQYWPHSFPAI